MVAPLLILCLVSQSSLEALDAGRNPLGGVRLGSGPGWADAVLPGISDLRTL